MKASLLLSGSPVVHLRVLTGSGVFGVELQRLVRGRGVSGSFVPNRATTI